MARTLSVLQLSGEVLSTVVDIAQEEKLQTVGDVKALLASVQEHYVGLVDLLTPSSGELLADSDEIPWESLSVDSGVPLLTYILRPPGPELEKVVAKIECEYPLPTGEGGIHFDSENPHHICRELMDSGLFQHAFCIPRESCSPLIQEFCILWRLCLLQLPAEKSNEVRPDGTTLLGDMIAAHSHSLYEPALAVVSAIALEFLRRQALVPEFVNRRIMCSLKPDSTMELPAVYLCLRAKQPTRGRRSPGQGSMMIASELLRVWADETPGILGCTRPNGDTMLHHILEPCHAYHLRDKSRDEAEFCETLAMKMSLRELCHRNAEGICALSYAETVAHRALESQFPASWADGWVRARDAVRDQMLSKCRKWGGARIQDLLELVQGLWDAIRSADDYDYDMLQTEHLEQVVEAMEGVVWRRLQKERDSWLEGGWEFQSRSMSFQITEVLNYYRPCSHS
eukprot:TRINITY_DN35065_c0_g1_i1.p1 TRINITY_DN35065_c0_g1~~TRINITY_DN35065_c0_g1_i1.p1  ORF type:complete len:479 (+),score=48.35 TRINITY_DN35065_c0_g1_i1:74-1438(+)